MKIHIVVADGRKWKVYQNYENAIKRVKELDQMEINHYIKTIEVED